MCVCIICISTIMIMVGDVTVTNHYLKFSHTINGKHT